jgi:uncharacterized membrane protein YbhN (UPF0104 family)
MALAGLLVMAVLLWLLLRRLDTSALWQAARALPWWAWALAAAGLLASYALRALRLRSEWRPRVGVGFIECLHLLLLHNAAVNLLPLRAGEAGYAWLIWRRWQVPVAQSVASLLRLRLQDAAVLAAFGLWWLLPLPSGLGALLALAFAGVCGLLAPALLKLLGGWAPQAWRAKLPQLPGTAAEARRGWVYAVANWAVKLAVLGGLLLPLAGLPLLAGLRGALGGELGALLPLQGPAGLGTYEAAVWAAVRLRGTVDMSQVAGAALLIHLFALLVGLGAAALSQLASLSGLRRPPLQGHPR